MRGEVYRLKAPRDARGHEQRGARYAVVLQSDDMALWTWLVAPTSTSARPATHRPKITVDGVATLVLVEQTIAIDPERLGPSVGRLSFQELAEVDAALSLVLGLQ